MSKNKTIILVLVASTLITIKALSNSSSVPIVNTILNTTIDMKAGSLEDFLLSQNIRLDEITKLVIVGEKYSNSKGINIVIEDKEKISVIWNTHFKNANSYNRYQGKGSRRLDIYTSLITDKPAMIFLVDPTDLTSPISHIDKGFKCQGLEKWILSELQK